MPDVPPHDPAETTAHDANGVVKMHTDMNDHLDRLFAADKAEIPWFVSLYQNIYDVIRPVKLPPLEITSKPVAVKSIWGLYAQNPKSFYSSTAILSAVFALLMVTFTNKVVQQWVGPGGDSLRVGLGSVWLTNHEKQNVWRFSTKQP